MKPRRASAGVHWGLLALSMTFGCVTEASIGSHDAAPERDAAPDGPPVCDPDCPEGSVCCETCRGDTSCTHVPELCDITWNCDDCAYNCPAGTICCPTCNLQGICLPLGSTCPPVGESPCDCAPQEAHWTGSDCPNIATGWRWTGSDCVLEQGCDCEGEDCGGLYDSEEQCRAGCRVP